MNIDRVDHTVLRKPHWFRPGLDVQEGVLHIAGQYTLTLAASEELPVFVTDLAWIGEGDRVVWLPSS